MNIKCNAAGPRGINVLVDGKVKQLVLQPGDVATDVKLVNPRDPIFGGLVAKREILIESVERAAAQAQAQAQAQVPALAPAEPVAEQPKAPEQPAPKPAPAPAQPMSPEAKSK